MVFASIMSVGWPIGEFFLALEAYFIRDHYTLQLVSHVPMFLVLIVIAFGIPESTRWLIAQKRYKDAEKQISKIASFNRTPVPEHLFVNNDVHMMKPNGSLTEKNILQGKIFLLHVKMHL